MLLHPASKLGGLQGKGALCRDLASPAFLGQGVRTTPLADASTEAALRHLRRVQS